MVPEVMGEDGQCCGIPIVDGRPDRRKMIVKSRIWLANCSLRDIQRVRRFILRTCSDGRQLTHEEFLRYYQVVEFLCFYDFISLEFNATWDESLSITGKGRKYLDLLDRELGEEIDCLPDGEPILRTRSFIIESREECKDG